MRRHPNGPTPTTTRGGWTLPVLAVLAALGAQSWGVPVAGQEPPRAPRPGEVPPSTVLIPRGGHGWLGIEFAWERREGEDGPRLVIRQIVPGSPAERAELRPGDRIVRFGEVAPEPTVVQARAARLRPGDSIAVEVIRPPETRPRRIILQAAERPFAIAVGPRGEWTFMSPDTFRLHVRINLDSIRMAMDRIRSGDLARELALVAEALGEHQEVRIERRRLFEEALRDQERELGVLVERFRFGDPKEAPRPGGEARVPAPASPREPLVVLRAGQRVVAGAEFAPLNPDLARYFGVDSGVLTVEVVEGTPAARGGLQGGDVIVRVDGQQVADVAALRTALERGYRTPPVPVTVVREGRTLELLFPR